MLFAAPPNAIWFFILVSPLFDGDGIDFISYCAQLARTHADFVRENEGNPTVKRGRRKHPQRTQTEPSDIPAGEGPVPKQNFDHISHDLRKVPESSDANAWPSHA